MGYIAKLRISTQHQIKSFTLTRTTNTGHLTLLVEVLTNFVVTAFIGLLSIPTGGTSCKKSMRNI